MEKDNAKRQSPLQTSLLRTPLRAGSFFAQAGAISFWLVPISRRTRLALWAATLLLALGLRLPAVTAGLPYLGYVDEGHVLHHVVRMLRTGSWDPGWYLYPSLPLTAIAAAARLEAPAYRVLHDHPLAADLSAFPPPLYDLVEPADLIILGRVLTLLAGLGIVLLTGLLARRFAGEAAGLLAAMCAAMVPALVIRGAVITVDPWAALFAATAIYCAEGAVRGDRPYRGALLAGAMTGLACASKYPAVLVAVAVGATLLRVARPSPPTPLPSPVHPPPGEGGNSTENVKQEPLLPKFSPLPGTGRVGDGRGARGEGAWRLRARCLEIAALAALAAVAVAMPAWVTNNHAVFTDIARQSVFYSGQSLGSYWDQAVRRAEWDQPLEHPELGAVFLAWIALGWLAALADRRSRATAVAWTLYAGVAALALCRYPFRPFRNVLPLIPLGCVLAALLVARLRERVPRRTWVDAGAVVLAGLLLLPPSLTYARGRKDLVDSRVQAVDWVRAHVATGDPLLVSQELAIVRSELRRLGGWAAVLPEREARKRLRRHGGFALVITGPGTGLPALLAAGGTREPYELAARFGESPGIGQWRGNREVVEVYRRIAGASPPQQQNDGHGQGHKAQSQPGDQTGRREAQLDAAHPGGHDDS